MNRLRSSAVERLSRKLFGKKFNQKPVVCKPFGFAGNPFLEHLFPKKVQGVGRGFDSLRGLSTVSTSFNNHSVLNYSLWKNQRDGK